MADLVSRVPLSVPPREEQMFPKLTPEQIERIAARGRVRTVREGEVLSKAGDNNTPFFVVKSGQIEIVQTANGEENLVAVHRTGQFTGEVNMLTGRRALASARVSEGGEVVELDRDGLLALVQTDSEIGEILMRAFILRRVELIAAG